MGEGTYTYTEREYISIYISIYQYKSVLVTQTSSNYHIGMVGIGSIG